MPEKPSTAPSIRPCGSSSPRTTIWRPAGTKSSSSETCCRCSRKPLRWHDRGTRHGIRVDADGLLRAGAPGVPLTWMDAKVGSWTMTPRDGKPVEVQALWYNALRILSDLEKRAGAAGEAASIAARARLVKDRFVEAFWNESSSCLFDVVDDGRKDASIRPNQIFALSLPYPLLPKDKARSVLAVIEEKLLTPAGSVPWPPRIRRTRAATKAILRRATRRITRAPCGRGSWDRTPTRL